MDIESIRHNIDWNNHLLEIAKETESTIILVSHKGINTIVNIRGDYANEFKKKIISFCNSQNVLLKKELQLKKKSNELDFNITDK